MISVIVPVYRNASTLRELAARIRAALADPELVFVNDASPDDAADVLATIPGIRMVTHETNRGQNAAVITGFMHARGETLVVLDADLQDPPEAIPELLRAKRERGAAVAFATREGVYAGKGRMWTSRIYKRVLSMLTPLPHGAGLFVAVDRDVAQRVHAMAPVPSVVAAIGLLRVPMIGVPVARAMSETSAYGGGDRLRLALRTLTWVLTHR